MTFLSQRCLGQNPLPTTTTTLREFFRRGGVRDAPPNGVEDLGVNFTIAQLKGSGGRVRRVDKKNFGYDLLARSKTGERMPIEVKGQTEGLDVELAGNEAASADKHKNEYYLAVVPDIPNNPALYVLNDPALVGKKDKLLVEITSWKAVSGHSPVAWVKPPVLSPLFSLTGPKFKLNQTWRSSNSTAFSFSPIVSSASTLAMSTR